jgi:hypothetical protein
MRPSSILQVESLNLYISMLGRNGTPRPWLAPPWKACRSRHDCVHITTLRRPWPVMMAPIRYSSCKVQWCRMVKMPQSRIPNHQMIAMKRNPEAHRSKRNSTWTSPTTGWLAEIPTMSSTSSKFHGDLPMGEMSRAERIRVSSAENDILIQNQCSRGQINPLNSFYVVTSLTLHIGSIRPYLSRFWTASPRICSQNSNRRRKSISLQR